MHAEPTQLAAFASGSARAQSAPPPSRPWQRRTPSAFNSSTQSRAATPTLCGYGCGATRHTRIAVRAPAWAGQTHTRTRPHARAH
eukprot:2210917-Prymnesium_polylepis.2